MAKTMTIYRITASWEHCGHLLDCTDAATLGDAYGEMYATIEDAEEMVEQLTDSVAEYDLDPSTSYTAEPVTVDIADVDADADYDGEGHAAVTARVSFSGPLAARTIDSAWYCTPRHCAAGIDGWEPAGDAWIDEDVTRLVGPQCAAAIGREIVAGVR
jgi:hypothetical protein